MLYGKQKNSIIKNRVISNFFSFFDQRGLFKLHLKKKIRQSCSDSYFNVLYHNKQVQHLIGVFIFFFPGRRKRIGNERLTRLTF